MFCSNISQGLQSHVIIEFLRGLLHLIHFYADTAPTQLPIVKGHHSIYEIERPQIHY